MSSYRKTTKKAIVVSAACAMVWFLSSAITASAQDVHVLKKQFYLEQIKANLAWNVATGTKKVVVAVIDTGVDVNNPNLAGNIWVNINELNENGLDDDRNGYVDDRNGWNFVEDDYNIVPTIKKYDKKTAVMHGTLIAGIVGSNGADGQGVGWNVSIMPLRAIKNDGTGDYETVTQAVNYAADNGANVITMSFVGSAPDPDLYVALRRAYDKGIVIVAAAGNHSESTSGNLNRRPVFPACYDVLDVENWIIGVGSVDEKDIVSRFSNTGNCVDIYAPGENIFSTQLYAPASGYTETFGGPWFGTSFAAPEVAGAAALILSMRPELRAPQIISALLHNADLIDGTSVVARRANLLRLNVFNALSSTMSMEVTSVSSPQSTLTFGLFQNEPVDKREYLTWGKNKSRFRRVR